MKENKDILCLRNREISDDEGIEIYGVEGDEITPGEKIIHIKFGVFRGNWYRITEVYLIEDDDFHTYLERLSKTQALRELLFDKSKEELRFYLKNNEHLIW